MAPPKSIGFPRMMKEQGEKRVFLPEFIQFLTQFGIDVFIEEGYGSNSGMSFDDYRRGNERVRMCTRRDAFQKDVILVLRSPNLDEFQFISPGACLISMLHFPTRPKRVETLKNLGVNAISLDSIVNDNNLRMVENMKAVSWNGLEAAFDVLEDRWPRLRRPDGNPIRSLILGTGMVGKHAVDSATKLGNVIRNKQHILDEGPGALAISVGRNISAKEDQMRLLFEETDILVDSTQRRDASHPVVPNEWIAWLPKHAILADLAVDPYTLDIDPPVVRGLEGIPQGNLDKYIFAPDDTDWDLTVPPSVPSQNRRTTVSCYSWPGIHPEACMRHYAQQLQPLMEVFLLKGCSDLELQGGYFERALFRGSLKYWLKAGTYEPRPR